MSWLSLIAVFIREFVRSVARVTWIVVTGRKISPKLVEMPLRVTGDGRITLLASLVTLTPGTLSVDVTSDGASLLIHLLDAPDEDAAVESIRETLEDGVLRAWK